MALAIFLFVLLDGVIRSRVDGVRLGAAWQQCELCKLSMLWRKTVQTSEQRLQVCQTNQITARARV